MADIGTRPADRTWWVAAAILAFGLVVGGWLLGDGLTRAKRADRAVTMRGLAERDVTADLATWTIAYQAQGSDLAEVQAKSEADTRTITEFFRGLGFPASALSQTGASVNQFYDSNRGVQNITVQRRLQLRTTDIARARRAFARQFDLVRAGVSLQEGSGMVYSFTRLDAIKPAMIAAATRDARKGAEQFAQDSGTAVGGIRQATQGYFSIGARDGENAGGGGDSPFQKVRVVTTIEFYLE